MSNSEMEASQRAATKEAVEPSLLDQIASATSAGPTLDDKQEARKWVRTFVQDILKDSTVSVVSPTAHTLIANRIAEIDQLVSDQLNEVLHDPKFQKLEATWRSLKYLVDQTETSDMLKIKVLNAPKTELLRDFQRAPKYDQSALWLKVYQDEFDMPGGEPFGAVIGDYEISRHPEDMELIEKISHVAAAAHAPFISAASPDLFKIANFTNLGERQDLKTFFAGDEKLGKWRTFRDSDDSRYVALTMPHILLRLPYGAETARADGFDFEEGVKGTDNSKYLWGNTAYALGARLTDAFARYGWCTAICGLEAGGLVEGLPTHTFPTDDGGIATKCPTEITISSRKEKELAELGFVPLAHYKNSDYAVFFSAQSCQRPKKYDKPDATASAQLSAQLPYLFACCRFAHYLMVMLRDKIGSPMSRAGAEDLLDTWIKQYIVQNEDVAIEEKRRKPLSAAEVHVEADPEKPGSYRAVVDLQPHLMLNQITVKLRLVAALQNVKRD